MTKAKIPTLTEKFEEAGLGGAGFDDDIDLEGVKVSELAKDEKAFVIYAAKELDSQFGEEGDKVFLVQIGDDKAPTHKFWSSHSALIGKLKSMVEHQMFPVATAVIERQSKAGRTYYDFK